MSGLISREVVSDLWPLQEVGQPNRKPSRGRPMTGAPRSLWAGQPRGSGPRGVEGLRSHIQGEKWEDGRHPGHLPFGKRRILPPE